MRIKKNLAILNPLRIMRIIINQLNPTKTHAAIPDREIEERLAGAGVRYTTGRRLVVAALTDAEGPRSAAELHGEMGGRAPLSSVYRSLAVLEEAGVVEPHHGARGLTRYEMAEWVAGHHHHIVCESCGMVADIELPRHLEMELERLVGEVAGLSSFSVTGHALEVDGKCANCR
jgi:Fur family ferric uptake transcriptional regulator